MPDQRISSMLTDSDWLIRLDAVRRAPLEHIIELIDDVAPDVRAVVHRRLEEFLREDET
jgi:hypothetical protein